MKISFEFQQLSILCHRILHLTTCKIAEMLPWNGWNSSRCVILLLITNLLAMLPLWELSWNTLRAQKSSVTLEMPCATTCGAQMMRCIHRGLLVAYMLTSRVICKQHQSKPCLLKSLKHIDRTLLINSQSFVMHFILTMIVISVASRSHAHRLVTMQTCSHHLSFRIIHKLSPPVKTRTPTYYGWLIPICRIQSGWTWSRRREGGR